MGTSVLVRNKCFALSVGLCPSLGNPFVTANIIGVRLSKGVENDPEMSCKYFYKSWRKKGWVHV